MGSIETRFAEGGLLARYDRLTCELAIWAEVTLKHGLTAFASQRAADLPLASPSDLAKRWGLPVWAVKRTIDRLRAETVLSAFAPDPGRYLILKPRRFLTGLTARITRRLGSPVTIALPPALRGKSVAEVLANISHILSTASVRLDRPSLAILHTAFAIEIPHIAQAQVYKGTGPITLTLTTDTLSTVEKSLNLVRLKSPRRPPSKENPLGLPEGFAFADLLVFARRPDVSCWAEFGPYARDTLGNAGIQPINPLVNLLLLSLFPLRGEEAAERLVETLRKHHDQGRA